MPSSATTPTESFSPDSPTGVRSELLGGSEYPMIFGDDLCAHDKIIAEVLGAFRKKFSKYILFGVGGSSLGGQVIQACSGKNTINFVENIDPHSMAALIAGKDLAETGILVVSKSGYTPETVAQLLTVKQVFQDKGISDRLRDVLILSVDEDTPLRRFAKEQGCFFVPHAPNIGGRFSILSSTGALVAGLLDFDMVKFRAGAEEAARSFKESGVQHFLSALESGVTNHVCMYYGDHLKSIAKWYRQLWSESLGKEGRGYELSLSRGVVDQHSQLQLYLDGPKTNYFTLLTAARSKNELPSLQTNDSDLAFLNGRTIADLFYAEELSTYQELSKTGLYVRRIELPASAETWGSLCSQLMLEVITLAREFRVDPFNQPAVESGKIRTREILRAN